MKKYSALALGILFLSPSFVFASQSLVQQNTGEAATITYSSPVVAGDLLVVAVGKNTSADDVGISDDQGNTWTEVVHGGTALAGVVSSGIFWAIANGNNSPTITISGSGTDPGGQIYEISGITSPTIDGAPTAEVLTAAGTQPCSSITTAGGDDLLVAFVYQALHGGTYTISSPWTMGGVNTGHADGSGYLLDATAGTYNCVWGFGGAVSQAYSVSVALAGGGGGGGGPTTTATSTSYIATKQEQLFVIAVFTFFAGVGFWERVLTLRRDKYRV